MKKRLMALTLALLCTFAFVQVASATTHLGFATGGTVGMYYALGGDIAALWTAKIPDMDVSVQTTGGSKANILRINDGDAELATVQNDVMYYAYQGNKDFFDGQVIDSFSAIGSLYPELVQIVVAAESDIKSIADLKGRAVSVGAVGSGVYFSALQVLQTAGLTLDDIEEQYLSFGESSMAFDNQQIECFFVTAGLPNMAIIEVATKHPVRLLGLDEAAMAALMDKYTFYIPITVEPGTYNGIKEAVTVPAVKAVLIASNSLSEDVVYQLTKVLFEDTVNLNHEKKADIKVENAVKGIPTPFHPGAEKYFKEIGLLGN